MVKHWKWKNSRTQLAPYPCHNAWSVECSILCSPSLQPISQRHPATLSFPEWCERIRGNNLPGRESTAQTTGSTGARKLCRLATARSPEQFCSPLQPADQHTFWGSFINIGRYSGGSPLLFTYCKASPGTFNCEAKDENSKLKGHPLAKSKDMDSFFPSLPQKIRKLEVSCKMNECLNEWYSAPCSEVCRILSILYSQPFSLLYFEIYSLILINKQRRKGTLYGTYSASQWMCA